MKIHPRTTIALTLGIVAIACLLLWLFGRGGASEFGLNAFTETLGIAITVFIIDYLIKRHERHRFLPQRASAYEDVRLMVSRIVSFWTEAYRLTLPDPPPASVKDLLSESVIQKIGTFLHLDSKANITPSRTCWDWVTETMSDTKQRADKILERHNGILDPTAYAAVHSIVSDIMEPGLMRGILGADQEMGFPRPKVLGNYCIFQRTYFDAILKLINWCESERKCLEGDGYSELKKVINSIHSWTPSKEPKCMIPMDLLKKQMDEVAAFRAKKSG